MSEQRYARLKWLCETSRPGEVDSTVELGMHARQFVPELFDRIAALERELAEAKDAITAEQTLRRIHDACRESAEKEVEQSAQALAEANRAWAAEVAKRAKAAEALERDKETWHHARGCLLDELRILRQALDEDRAAIRALNEAATTVASNVLVAKLNGAILPSLVTDWIAALEAVLGGHAPAIRRATGGK